MSHGPLTGIRVLDLSRILAGPSCTQLLGDYGADIIKVEKPGKGDDTRSWGPPYVTGKDGEPTTESAYYLSSNRNKRSIAIDIASEDGADIVRKLVKNCDILIENFKPGGLAKYGLSYDDLASEHPSLIYCSISGFGQNGPNSHKPGYDLLAQAEGGIMSVTGAAEGEPMKVGVAIADLYCGMQAATAILAALHHRDRTGGKEGAEKGEGQHIDLALMDSTISWLANQGTNYLSTGKIPKRHGNQHPNIVPYQVFEAIDGHVVVAAGNDEQFKRFCKILNLEVLANNSDYQTNPARLKNREALIEILETAISKFPKSELISNMEKYKIPGGSINTLDEVFNSEQVKHREMRISMEHDLAASGNVELIGNPVKFSKTPISYRQAPPTCGQHSEEILAEFFDDTEKQKRN